ncbi:hypothetical protein ACQU0X_23910 [Pseudovibrio ascidiaceicola]|uniref:hypothetical protein n=1 Tax=Pseudovibrio ascidiaceicola TaxID=285279 RepID=UPI003D36D766
MAEFKTQTIIEAKAAIIFGEHELRALDAMIGYGADKFLQGFYKQLGTHYMKPYEQDLRALFKTLDKPVRQALAEADDARRKLNSK